MKETRVGADFRIRTDFLDTKICKRSYQDILSGFLAE